MSKFCFIAMISMLLCSFNSNAQQKVDAKSQLKEMLLFFCGSWSGTGHFANGKPISATASFSALLDSSWIAYTHTDNAPNNYKALAMWGVDAASGNVIAELFDNFGGKRLFTTNGWDGKTLILYHSNMTKDQKKLYQRFSYQVLDKNKFDMRYEVSSDSLTWHMGDELIFNRLK